MAEPLTPQEYAEWRANLYAIEAIHAGEPRPEYGLEITTTIEIQKRLFATIDRLRTIEQELVSACELLGLHECSVRVLLRHLRNNYSAALGALRSVISRLEERLKAEKRAGRIL